MALARQAAPEQRVTRRLFEQSVIFLKVKRVSLSEAAQLEPNVCLSGVGGALVAPNEVPLPPTK